MKKRQLRKAIEMYEAELQEANDEVLGEWTSEDEEGADEDGS